MGAVGRVGCCVEGGVPSGGKHIIIYLSAHIEHRESPLGEDGSRRGKCMLITTHRASAVLCGYRRGKCILITTYRASVVLGGVS